MSDLVGNHNCWVSHAKALNVLLFLKQSLDDTILAKLEIVSLSL